MLEFIGGIALGAAFSPFWMLVWNKIRGYIMDFLNKKNPVAYTVAPAEKPTDKPAE